jgi:hypothetical protein
MFVLSESPKKSRISSTLSSAIGVSPWMKIPAANTTT